MPGSISSDANAVVVRRKSVDQFILGCDDFAIHCGNIIKERGLVVKPPIVLPVTLRPAFRADPEFDGSWVRQRPAAPTAPSLMLHRITDGEFLTLGNLLQSPTDDFDGLGVVGVLRLGGELDFVRLGVENPHIGVVGFVVGAGQKSDEEGLAFLGPTDAEGVVRSLSVVNSEDGPTRTKKFRISNFIHRDHIL